MVCEDMVGAGLQQRVRVGCLLWGMGGEGREREEGEGEVSKLWQ